MDKVRKKTRTKNTVCDVLPLLLAPQTRQNKSALRVAREEGWGWGVD